MKTSALYGAVGVQFVAAVAVGMWIGGYCDRRWGTAPWLGLAGIVLGIMAGFLNLYRILQWKDRRRDDE